MFQRVDRFLFRGGPVGLEQLWQGRALFVVCFFLFWLGPISIGVSWVVGHKMLVRVLAVGWLLALTPPFVLRWTRSSVAAGSWLTFLMMSASGVAAFVHSGFEGLYGCPNNLVPFFSIMVIGRWEAGVVVSVLLAAETVLFYMFLRQEPCSDSGSEMQLLVVVLYSVYPVLSTLFGVMMHFLRSAMLAQVTENTLAKERRVVNLAHDLRTPLNGAIGVCEMLQQMSTLTDVQLDLLAAMEATHAGLLDVINDIVIASALEAGVTLGQQESVTDIYRLLNRVHDTFRYSALNKRIGLVLHVPRSEFRFVRVDGQRIHQILVNLVGNAIKFTHRGRVVISVSGAMVAEGEKGQQATLCFSVRDDGIGIDEAFVERFRRVGAQRFAQTAEGKLYGGSGLGLFVVQGLCASLGARLTIESVPKIGSTMEFVVPVSLAGSERSKDFQIDHLHWLNCEALTNDMLGDLPMIAERRWDRKVSSSVTLEGLSGLGMRTLVLLPCSSPAHMFDYLEKERLQHVRCCDALATCRFSLESKDGEQSCVHHCSLPLSVFQVFGVLTGEAASARRAVQWIHPKATPQGELDAEISLPRRSSGESLIDGTARRLSSTPRVAADPEETEDALLLPPGHAYRVLVVDDNLLMRKVIISQLGQVGITDVKQAESGSVALDMCSQEVFDMVMVDCQMPFMSGIAVCQRLREQEQKGHRRRVIVLHSASLMEYKQHGADHFVEKPFSNQKLRALFCKYVNLPAKEQ
jgi:two-component system sensor histidine kinase/response regulator